MDFSITPPIAILSSSYNKNRIYAIPIYIKCDRIPVSTGVEIVLTKITVSANEPHPRITNSAASPKKRNGLP